MENRIFDIPVRLPREREIELFGHSFHYEDDDESEGPFNTLPKS